MEIDYSDAPKVLGMVSDRNPSFKKSLELLDNHPTIVEIGCSRYPDDLLDGDSTSIWAWYISKYGGSYYGCDNNDNSVKNGLNVLSKYTNNPNSKVDLAEIIKADGIEFLKNFNHKRIDLLYLDGPDPDGYYNYSCGLFHLECFMASQPSLFINSLVLIDDIGGEATNYGKGSIFVPYLLARPSSYESLHKNIQWLFKRIK